MKKWNNQHQERHQRNTDERKNKDRTIIQLTPPSFTLNIPWKQSTSEQHANYVDIRQIHTNVCHAKRAELFLTIRTTYCIGRSFVKQSIRWSIAVWTASLIRIEQEVRQFVVSFARFVI